MVSYEGSEYYKILIEKIPLFFRKIVLHRIENTIHLIASILAIITPVIIFLLASSPNTPAFVAIITLGLITIVFALLFLVEEYRLSSKARYAEVMSGLHLCIHILRDIHSGLNDKSIKNENILSDLSMALWSLAKCFSLLKGVHCRTCIKLIHFNEDVFSRDVSALSDEERLRYLYVKTLCRDFETTNTHNFIEEGNPKDHTIIGNSDFRDLYSMVQGSHRYWCSNDIRSMSGYQNTRFNQTSNLDYIGYRSVLILPIRIITKGLLYPEQKSCKQDILGFLCIDSKTRGIFNDRYDPELGSSFADALFILFKEWFRNEIQKEKEINNERNKTSK